MKVTVIVLMTMSTILVSHLASSAPTPQPAFPFTTLPKKGEGHRKIAGLKRKGRDGSIIIKIPLIFDLVCGIFMEGNLKIFSWEKRI